MEDMLNWKRDYGLVYQRLQPNTREIHLNKFPFLRTNTFGDC